MKKLSLGLLFVTACGGTDAPVAESVDEAVILVSRIPRAPAFRLRFPIHSDDRALIAGVPTIGMDHDPAESNDKMDCTNHDGFSFPFCYNQHDGTDYMLTGGFPQMDANAPRVVAAAAGEVIEVVEHGYDRCSADAEAFDVSCHGHEMINNRVVIRHSNGWTTSYLHLKTNSVIVTVGQQVTCGQVLGRVGSAGRSSAPHLHFALHNANGTLIDPYSGTESQSTSYWTLQAAPDGLPGDLCAGEVDAITCGWRTISDAAVCGTIEVTNAFLCGVEEVTSSAMCGTEYVTSAAQCGTQLVTSAQQCGTDVVTSAAQCGTSFLGSITQCLSRGLSIFNGGCNVPNTCTVPRSCNVPRSCTVPQSCDVASTCEQPASCTIYACS